jgi:hypothetical protein
MLRVQTPDSFFWKENRRGSPYCDFIIKEKIQKRRKQIQTEKLKLKMFAFHA